MMPMKNIRVYFILQNGNEYKMPPISHLITLADLSSEQIHALLDDAEHLLPYVSSSEKSLHDLQNKVVINLFFEPSTRTRTTFEIAAKRLDAHVVNIDMNTSSLTKGESLLDTIANLEAMHPDIFIIRHGDNGAAQLIADHLKSKIAVINAGDGRHAHPTQGLLDMLTIRRHKGAFEPLSVAIVGDILHSRVARTDIIALQKLGVHDLRLIAPATLLPAEKELRNATIFTDIEQGLRDVDVIITLRLQRERMQQGLVPSLEEYYATYGLTPERLRVAKPDAIVMHPGPMNRGVEIADAVADGPQSVILQQVTHGVAIRMAVMRAVIK